MEGSSRTWPSGDQRCRAGGAPDVGICWHNEENSSASSATVTSSQMTQLSPLELSWKSSTCQRRRIRSSPHQTHAVLAPHHEVFEEEAPSNHDEDEVWRRQIAGKLRNVDKPHPHGLVAGLKLAFKYVVANAANNSRSTAIGVTTVFIVVFFVGILQNIVLRAPLIFLRLAEITAGEMDMVLAPVTVSFDPLLNKDTGVTAVPRFSFFNATDVHARLSGNPLVVGASPRWIMRGKISAQGRDASLVTSILVCDDEEEARMGVGRGWPYRTLGEGEAHVSASVLRSLKVPANKGQSVMVDIGVSKLLATFNLSSQGIRSALFDSIMNDGVTIVLNGTRIEDYFARQGFPFPRGTLPAQMPTVFPVRDLVNFESLVDSAVDGVVNGNLMNLKLSVVDGLRASYERYPPIGNVVLVNSRYFLQVVKFAANKIPLVQVLNLAANTNRTGDLESALLLPDTPVTDSILGSDMSQYAFSMVVMYRDRLTSYLKGTQGTLDDLTHFANTVGDNLGPHSNLRISLPVHDALTPLKYLRIFLQQIFNSVVFVTVCHGCLTVYSLLLSDSGARTYEYGMLRMMGMRKPALGQLLMIQAMIYAVPGVALGLLLAWAASFPLLLLIAEYSATDPDFSYRLPALVVSTTLGFVMSICGNWLPIRRALSRSLAESLDVYHKATSETTVRSVRLEDLGLSPSQTTLAVGLIFAGATVYYVIPMSFVFRDFDLLLSSLNAILISTVVGLVILSVLVQPSLEALVVKAIMRGKDAKLCDLVLKNLNSHRDKARKTSLMFTSSLAFLIFAGAMFALQAESIIGNLKVFLGSDLRVYSNVGPLDQDALDALMNSQAVSKGGSVVEHAWASWPIWNVDPPVQTVRVSNLVSFPRSYPAEFVCVSANFLAVTYGEFFLSQSSDGCRGTDCVREMDVGYEQAVVEKSVKNRVEVLSHPVRDAECKDQPGGCGSDGSGRWEGQSGRMQFEALVPASLGSQIQAEVGTPLILLLVCQNARSSNAAREYLYFQLMPKALVSKMPGFFFSSYGVTARINPPMVIVGPQVYQRLFDICTDAVGLNATAIGLPTRPQQRTLHVRLREGVTEDERLDLMDMVRPLIEEQVTVTDTLSYLALTRQTVDLLMAFFYVVAVVASLLCFFMLFTTFEANVRENLWEFGVLRALGVSSRQLLRVFVFEALGMIIAAIILGTSIGLAIACTLTLQQNLFTEMPFRLSFPGLLFASVIAASIFVAGLGASLPVRVMLPRPIAQVLKGK